MNSTDQLNNALKSEAQGIQASVPDALSTRIIEQVRARPTGTRISATPRSGFAKTGFAWSAALATIALTIAIFPLLNQPEKPGLPTQLIQQPKAISAMDDKLTQSEAVLRQEFNNVSADIQKLKDQIQPNLYLGWTTLD